ncbi:MAG: leucine-rich repeat domain-containing protein [Clostridia bacterium]|nr:leucine-rich repeat domain-containing protein [Clostridia bacterium]
MKQTIKSNLKKLFVSVLSIMVFLSGLGSTGIVAMAEVLSSVDSLNEPNIQYYTGGNSNESAPEVGEFLASAWAPESFVAADWCDTTYITDGRFVISSSQVTRTIWTTKNFDFSEGFSFKGTLTMKNGYNNYYGEWCSAYFGTETKNLELRIKNDSPNNSIKDNTYTAYILYNGQELATYDLTTLPNGEYEVTYKESKVSVRLGGVMLNWTLTDGTTATEIPVTAALTNAKLGLRLTGNYGPQNGREWANISIKSICDHVYANACDADCNECGEIRTVGVHVYDNACDPDCNECGETRVTQHLTTLYEMSNAEVNPFELNNGIYNSTNKNHNSTSTFTITALSAFSLDISYYTSTESGYDKLIITQNDTTKVTQSGITNWQECSLNLVAGDKVYIKYSKDTSQSSGSDTVWFKLNITPNLAPDCEEDSYCILCGVLIKAAGDHIYDNACDTECNECRKIRQVGDHVYTNGCDTDCNICGFERITYHIYDDVNDSVCNECGYIRNLSSLPKGVCGTNLNWVFDNGTGTLYISGEGAMYNYSQGTYYTPSDYTVGTEVAPWSVYKNQILNIVIDDDVTSIGSYAFYGCNAVKKITLPFVGKTINNTNFGYIFGASDSWNNDSYVPSSLKEVVITKATSIGYDAFRYCSYITSITIPDSVTSIGGSAFYGCTALTSITIPDSVTSIGSSAFYGCTALTSITIPDSVTTIGNSAFYNCTKLINIDLPDRQVSFGDGAFYGTAAYNDSANWQDGVFYLDNHLILRTGNPIVVTVKSGTKYIANNAFSDCTSLTSITIPDSVTTIGGSAFYGCTGLTSITIPDSVTTIGNYAFYGCTGLTSITIPDSVTTIGNDAFSGCTSLNRVNITDLAAWSNISFGNYIANPLYYAKKLYLNNKLVTELILPEGTTTINSLAFYYCDSITSIVVPDSVTTIERGAFASFTSLTKITLPFVGQYSDGSGNTELGWLFCDYDGYINHHSHYYYDHDYNYHVPSTLKEVVITKAISEYAFYGCTGLTSITIPNSVTSIGGSAFSGCTGLTSITIPNSVTTIGGSAFSGCTGLTSIAIPGGVKTIGSYAFNGCKKITNLTIGNGVETIGDYAFCGCYGLKTVVVPDSATYIGYRAFAKCKSLEEITLPFVGSEKDPSGYVYNNSDYFGYIFGTGYTGGDSGYEIPASLKKVVITKATIIPAYAFMGCSTLETIIIPDTVKTIGARAFCDCTSATTIYLPQGLEYIGISAFSNSGFYNDKSNWQGDALYYGDYLIKYDTNGSAYVVKDGTQLIAGGAFQNCVTSRVVLPDGLKYICDYAFDGCANITRIIIPSSVIQVGDNAFRGCQSLSGVYITDLAAWCNTYFYGYYSNPLSFGEKLYLNGKLVTNLVIPASVTSIGQYAFIGCTSITSVTIPETVTAIGECAFLDCSSIESVVIPETVTEIGGAAFPHTTVIYGYEGTAAQSFAAIYGNRFVPLDRFASDYEFKVLPDGTVEITNYIGNDTQIVIPETINGMKVTSIGEYAFYFCDIASVVVHSGVTSIGKNAFAYCDYLEKIEIHNPMCDVSGESNTIPSYVTVYGYTGSKAEMYATANKNEFVAFENDENYIFGTCGENAKWCLDLNAGVLTIYGTGATYNYVNVGNVNPFVEHRANIKSIVIDDGITHLGNRLFKGLNHTTSVKFGKDVKTMGYEVFYGCTKLSDVTLNEGLTELSSLTFYNCTKLTQIDIPSTVKTINHRVFKQTGLTSINIPDTVTYMGYEVFMNCYDLAEVDFTEGVGFLNARMFENCTKLTDFYFTDNMCRIRSRAFYGCTALESITFEDANRMWASSDGQESRIHSTAFEGCNSSLQMIAKDGTHVKDYAKKRGFEFISIESVFEKRGAWRAVFLSEDVLCDTKINIHENLLTQEIGDNFSTLPDDMKDWVREDAESYRVFEGVEYYFGRGDGAEILNTFVSGNTIQLTIVVNEVEFALSLKLIAENKLEVVSITGPTGHTCFDIIPNTVFTFEEAPSMEPITSLSWAVPVTVDNNYYHYTILDFKNNFFGNMVGCYESDYISLQFRMDGALYVVSGLEAAYLPDSGVDLKSLVEYEDEYNFTFYAYTKEYAEDGYIKFRRISATELLVTENTAPDFSNFAVGTILNPVTIEIVE